MGRVPQRTGTIVWRSLFKTTRQARRGFTLIEIFTVLGIMMILGALSFAVFARVREQGRSANCQSNLKQIGLAMQQYVQDNDGGYPIFRGVDTDSSNWSDRLRLYTKNHDVFYCPSFPFVRERGAVSGTRSTSYNLNVIRISYWHDSIGHAPKKEAETSQLLSPSATWLNVCPDTWLEAGVNILTDDKVFDSSCGRKIGLNIGEHHSGGTNWSFVDGHVKWMTSQQVADLDCGNPPLPPNFTPK